MAYVLWVLTHSPPGRYSNWTIDIKLQWNLNQNQYIFIQENSFAKVVCKMAAILSKGRRVNGDQDCNDIWHHWATRHNHLTHWPPEKGGRNLKESFFKLILWIDISSIFYEIGLRWVPQEPIDDKSTLVQVMAWCRQATSHYLSQCWPRSMSPYGITRPQWVNDKAAKHTSTLLN